MLSPRRRDTRRLGLPCILTKFLSFATVNKLIVIHLALSFIAVRMLI